MTEMLERVKAAIREAAVPHYGQRLLDPLAPNSRSLAYYASLGVDSVSHDNARVEMLFDIAAREAIKAMQGPTGKMFERCIQGNGGRIDDHSECYNAMIKAALA